MAEKDNIVGYFETLQLAQQMIGYSRENRKHLQRLEEVKEILLNGVEGHCDERLGVNFSDDVEGFYLGNELLKKVYLRLCTGLTHCCVPGVPKMPELETRLSIDCCRENGRLVKFEYKRDLEVVDGSPSPSISRRYLKNLLDRIISLRAIKSRWNYRKIV